MSHYYGTVNGGRSTATRCGHKTTGLHTVAGSWGGGVEVHLYYDKDTDTDMAEISLCRWQGSGTQKVLYRGPVSEYKNLLAES